MIQNRDSARRFFIEVWRKHRNSQPLEPLQELVLGVILEHPEYHAILDQGEESVRLDFSPEAGTANPFLHMSMHIAIKEQIQTDRPVGICHLHQSLLEKTGDGHELEHRMMDSLAEMLWLAQSNNTLPDEQAYLESLRGLG